MEAFNNFVTAANGILWGPIMLVALIGLSGVIASETKKYVDDKDAEWGGLMKWMDDVAPQIDK